MKYRRFDLARDDLGSQPRLAFGNGEVFGWQANAGELRFAWWDAAGDVVHTTSEKAPDWLDGDKIRAEEGDDGTVVLNLNDISNVTREVRHITGFVSQDVTSWTVGQDFLGVPSNFGFWRGSRKIDENRGAAVLHLATKQVQLLPQPAGQWMAWCSAVLGPAEFVASGPTGSYLYSGASVMLLEERMAVGGRNGWLVGLEGPPVVSPIQGFRFKASPGSFPLKAAIPRPPGVILDIFNLASDRNGNVTGTAVVTSVTQHRPFLYDGTSTRWLDDVVPGTYKSARVGCAGHILTSEGTTDVLLVPDVLLVSKPESEPLTFPIHYVESVDENGLLRSTRVFAKLLPNGVTIWIPIPKPQGPRPHAAGELDLIAGVKVEVTREEYQASAEWLRESLGMLEALANPVELEPAPAERAKPKQAAAAKKKSSRTDKKR